MNTTESPQNDKQKESLSDKDLYEQGSKCCQQYSQLTMQIRTLAQQIMIGYVVGISLALTRSPQSRTILLVAGGVICSFAYVLDRLHYHYAMAFRTIRNLCLVRVEDKTPSLRVLDNDTSLKRALENREALFGPWQAHYLVRKKECQFLYWHSPFLVLGLLGVGSIIWGIILPYF